VHHNEKQDGRKVDQEAKSEGLLRQALSRRAYTIATRAREDLTASYSAGIITDEAF
jgi:hypothetical protein